MVRETTLGSRAFDIVLIVLLVGIALLCVLPLWYTLAVSLSDNAAASSGRVSFWPVGFNLNAYREIMGDGKFFNSFWISIQRVVLGSTLNFIIIVLMGYPLSKNAKDLPYRNVLMWILVFTMLFNGGLIPWYQTVKSLGLINNIWALVLGNSVPVFSVILVINYFRNLPKELEEAALVDGAGPWYMLVKLFIPLAVPVLATVTLFSIVYHWNEFFNGLVLMSNADHYPLQTYIQQLVVIVDANTMTAEQIQKMSELSNQTLNAAKIFIAMLPVLVIYPFLQRFFIHGITLGSVKE
ncbi:carbohydrate ABC transporter permease [Paenibacillus sp. GCM10023248]|uniref:carbohydrate ABC transporter permease n=1 Tax=Bacillales TaxID=1385 RepID=UPI0023782C5A|nr:MULTISPECIES: carbohydrate ABC transporter permease [Bacillales]MDD9268988.1 carbohydrate ABC transporter permease [Paenibacillus sp. MAHUQ-63]MDR6885012.1 ABC-type glycerol-3-phosphate transport system permease component [Bacillus sp. 3255]